MKKIVVIAVLLAAILFVGYEALIIIDDNFRYGRMRETPAVRPHEKELLTMKQGVIPFEGGEAIYRAADGKRLKSPFVKGDPNSIKLGKISSPSHRPEGRKGPNPPRRRALQRDQLRGPQWKTTALGHHR
jgi:hypothetical protein